MKETVVVSCCPLAAKKHLRDKEQSGKKSRSVHLNLCSQEYILGKYFLDNPKRFLFEITLKDCFGIMIIFCTTT